MNMDMDELSVIVSIIAIIFSVISFIITCGRNKRVATIEAFGRLQSETLDYINIFTKEEIEVICDNGDIEKYIKLKNLLARIEHFSVGVYNGVYDKKTLLKIARFYIIEVYDLMQPIIDREIQKDVGLDRPYMYFVRLRDDVCKQYGFMDFTPEYE